MASAPLSTLVKVGTLVRLKLKNAVLAVVVVVLTAIAVASCSTSLDGSASVVVIQPVQGSHCQYTAAEAPLTTLSSLAGPAGQLGTVVYHPANVVSDDRILDEGSGFSPVDTEFFDTGKKLVPANFQTLYAASLYYAMETGNRLFSTLVPGSEPTVTDPTMASTQIIYEAKRSFGDPGEDPEVRDNAEYIGRSVSVSGQKMTRNYILSYPTEDVATLPLGFNTGIMVHEFTHLAFHHLFYKKAAEQDLKASPTTLAYVRSYDEGNADYFGYLATRDAGFFLCSFPKADRDLSVMKSIPRIDAEIKADVENYDVHAGGAVWAAIQYRIGQQVGFEKNGAHLIRLMQTLTTCAGSGKEVTVDFSVLHKCQLAVADTADHSAINAAFAAAAGGK